MFGASISFMNDPALEFYEGMSKYVAWQNNGKDWKCSYSATTHHPSKKKIYIKGFFDGSGDLKGNLFKILQKRLRKPHLWFGVEVIAETPLGQKVSCIFEENKMI